MKSMINTINLIVSQGSDKRKVLMESVNREVERELLRKNREEEVTKVARNAKINKRTIYDVSGYYWWVDTNSIFEQHCCWFYYCFNWVLTTVSVFNRLTSTSPQTIH